MTAALWLLAVQGALGAFDTLYYHEWKARLSALRPHGGLELRLHAARDFIYAILFATLPWVAWDGLWGVVLVALILAEIAITLADFAVEDRVRAPLGGVFPGERAMHTVMAIVYGAMLANLLPEMLDGWGRPSALAPRAVPAPELLRWTLGLMAAGVLISGFRDAIAARRVGGA